MSEFDTLAEFKDDLRKKLTGFYERQDQMEKENMVMDVLVKDSEVEIPEAMIQEEAQRVADDYNNQLQQRGQSIEQYLTALGMKPEDFRNTILEAAEQRVKTRLVLDAVFKAENMEITEEETNAALEEMGKEYAMPAEELKNMLDMEQFAEDQRLKKASKFIMDNAKVVAPKKTAKKSSKKAADKDEEKPAEKKTAKKTTKKAAEDGAEAEKKPAAKKRTTKKAAEEGEETAKKPAAKKTAKKAEKTEEK